MAIRTDQTQPIAARLVCSSSSHQVTHVYTGFGLLARQGRVKVTATRAPKYFA